MLSRSVHKSVYISASAVALALALVRCAPVASSLSKSTFGLAGGIGANAPSQSSPGGISGAIADALPSARGIQLLRAKTRILDNQEAELVNAQKSNGLSISLTTAQLLAFRKYGIVDLIHDPHLVIDSARIRMQVTLTREEIEADGLDVFEAELRPKEKGLIRLGIPNGSDPDITLRILDHIVDVTIVLETASPETPKGDGPEADPSSEIGLK